MVKGGKLPAIVNGGKENSEPQTIPSQKKRKTSKKEHNLSKNILKNQPNWFYFIQRSGIYNISKLKIRIFVIIIFIILPNKL